MGPNSAGLMGALWWHKVRGASPECWINCPQEVFIFVKQRLHTRPVDLGEVVVYPSASDNLISKLWSVAPCPR